MVLTLRPTGLQSPAYEDWADYSIYEDFSTLVGLTQTSQRRFTKA